MKIAIGCDHGGKNLKDTIITHLTTNGYEIIDVGCYSHESVDFPIYAKNVAELIVSKKAELGILCCGTGIGMSIAANKIKGIRAAVVADCFSAKATREHNDSNVLCLGERVLGIGLALNIVDIWVTSEFAKGRHKRRVDMVTELENK